jgi:hypothetical protein
MLILPSVAQFVSQDVNEELGSTRESNSLLGVPQLEVVISRDSTRNDYHNLVIILIEPSPLPTNLASPLILDDDTSDGWTIWRHCECCGNRHQTIRNVGSVPQHIASSGHAKGDTFSVSPNVNSSFVI